jgi:flagellar hook-length control protein FliK
MFTDLLFMNSMPKNFSTSAQCIKNESCAPPHRSKSKAPDETLASGDRGFAKTLQKASQQAETKSSDLKSGRTNSSDCRKFESTGKLDKPTVFALKKESEASGTSSASENTASGDTIPAPPSQEFSIFFSMLEQMGLYDPSGGRDFQGLSPVTVEHWDDAAGLLNILQSWCRPSESISSSDLTLKLTHLRQLIAEALGSKTSWLSAENTADGLNSLAEKSVQTISILDRLIAELKNDTQEAGASKHFQTSGVTTLLENQPKGELSKLKIDTAHARAEDNDSAQKSAAMKLPSNDASRLESNSESTDKNQAAGRSNRHRLNPAVLEFVKRLSPDPAQESKTGSESTPALKTTIEAKTVKSIETLSRHGNESQQQLAFNGESSTVSKMIKDAQGVRESQIKMGSSIGNEIVSKISVADPSSSYTSLLKSDSQTPEKGIENLSTAKETDTGHQNLRTQAMDQIVRKATLQLGNGQYEAKIDLKPNYLGHLRMQVITENQQVTIKILAEFSFVKDLVENNIHQLKADLQQQGLSFDKLEVSLSDHESQFKQAKQKADRSDARQRDVDQNDSDSSKGEHQLNLTPSRTTNRGEATVDYFA